MTTSNKLTHEEFTNKLSQFIGSMGYYRVGLTPIVVTDGVKYFADTCDCYWLLDIITIGLFKLHQKLGYLFIEIDVNKNHTVHITVREDKDMPVVFEKKQRDICKEIPVGSYMLYLMNNVLLLPTEY